MGRRVLRAGRLMTALASSTDRDTLHDQYRRVRDYTEALAAPLSPEDQVVQSMPDVSPTKWHRAHTTWFFETFLLGPSLPRYATFDPAYAFLFNSYYEAVGPRHPRPQRGLALAAECRRHRALPRACRSRDARPHRRVRRAGRRADRTRTAPRAAAPRAAADGHQARAVVQSDRPGLRHRRSAAADTRRAAIRFGCGRHRRPSARRATTSRSTTSGPRHVVHLDPFVIADRLVTAGEWLEFIADDGYGRPELWLSDGWHAVQEQELERAVLLAHDGDDGWTVFTLAGRRAARPQRTRRPRQPLRSRRVRALARRAPADRVRMGARGAIASRPARCTTSTTRCGSGRRARTSPIRASSPRRARSVSTTGSS